MLKAISTPTLRSTDGGRCVSQDGDPSEDGSSRSLGASSTAQKRRVPSRAAETAWCACGKYATAVTTSWCAWTCATAALEANMLQRHVEITGSLVLLKILPKIHVFFAKEIAKKLKWSVAFWCDTFKQGIMSAKNHEFTRFCPDFLIFGACREKTST